MTISYHLEKQKQKDKIQWRLRPEGGASHSFLEKEIALSLGPLEQGSWILLPERSFVVLKKLASIGQLFYGGKKLFVDPFTPFELLLDVTSLERGALSVTGRWKIGSIEGKLHQVEGLCLGRPTWIIAHGTLRQIQEELPLKWVRRFIDGPIELAPQEAAEFLEDFEEETALVWKNEKAPLIDPIPSLHLTDRHGAFANLFFDYGPFKEVSKEEKSCPSWRNLESEKGWERDFLETDFIYKPMEGSSYFCPLDKVGKSLTFLLEIGWKIQDAKGRCVFRLIKEELFLEEKSNHLLLRGKMDYGSHVANVQDVIGAFNRREQFVLLSSDSVGLIDDSIEKRWGDLQEEEIVQDGIIVPKHRMGLLHAFQEDLQSINQEWKQRLFSLKPSSTAKVGSDFRATLFDYQLEGLQWLQFLNEGGLGGILADEMGLGKTVQVLAFFSQLEKKMPLAPLLIVVPTSLVFHWKKEIEKFLPSHPIYVHQGIQRERSLEELKNKPLILISYALLRQEISLFQCIEYRCVILDEAQNIKNPESQTAKAAYSLQSHMRLAITGTPIENSFEDLWSLAHFILPGLLKERSTFQKEMASSQLDGRILERTKAKIRPFLLRRKKQDVALELPGKFEQTVYVEMTPFQREIYEEWLQKMKGGLLKKISVENLASHRMEILEAILRLRQLCAHPFLIEQSNRDIYEMSGKYERLFSDLMEVVEDQGKVLVYSQFTHMLKLIQLQIKEKGFKSVYLDGSTKNREEIVRQFQEDPSTHIFLISLKAGGVGLNLTAADYVFLYDPWWNDAVEQQAIDRAHRVGKKSRVIARRYITALSIEEKMMRLKALKKGLSESLLDSTLQGEVSWGIEELLTLIE